MPSLPPVPARLSKIDELVRADHFHLFPADDCYFLWEWNGEPYAKSATTNFIGNFQKEPRFTGQKSWWYKEQAIDHAAFALARTLPASWRAASTFVPVPPSKIRSDPRHDSRLVDTLSRVSPALSDVRDIVNQSRNTESRRKGIGPGERLENWAMDAVSDKPLPVHIVVFDDLLSGGSHFAAMKIGLSRLFPGVRISGVFLARRVASNRRSL